MGRFDSLRPVDVILHAASYLEGEEYALLAVCSRALHGALGPDLDLRRPYYFLENHAAAYPIRMSGAFHSKRRELEAAGHCHSDAMARACKTLGRKASVSTRERRPHRLVLASAAWRYREHLDELASEGSRTQSVHLQGYVYSLLEKVDLQAADWASRLRAVRVEQLRIQRDQLSGCNYFSRNHRRNYIPD